MKFAVISDLHLGDPACGLVQKSGGGEFVIGDKYDDLRRAIGADHEYLVLLGDIFDFAISSYAEAFAAAKVFFEQIARDRLAREFIFVPGNHDSNVWDLVEYEVNVINRFNAGEMPRLFKGTVPGVIDLRRDSNKPGLRLPNVSPRTGGGADTPRYGGLYLDHLLDEVGPEPNRPVFNVVYPNLYLVDDRQSVLLTHGHYLSSYWSFLSDYGPRIVGPSLLGDSVDLKELVQVNFPLNQLACAGVGQAGPFTRIARSVQREVKDKDLTNIRQYVDDLGRIVDEAVQGSWIKEKITDRVIKWGKDKLLDKLRTIEHARWDEAFAKKPTVQKRFRRYYRATTWEIDRLNDDFGYAEPRPIEYPKRVIFGHTHQAISWNEGVKAKVDGLNVLLSNGGGWLYKKDDTGKLSWRGGEVFLFEEGRFRSVRV